MKKIIYIFLATILGVFIGANLDFLTEQWLIHNSLSQGKLPTDYLYFNSRVYLSPYLSFLFFAIGAFCGFLAGVRWWQMVYVEKRRWWGKRISIERSK